MSNTDPLESAKVAPASTPRAPRLPASASRKAPTLAIEKQEIAEPPPPVRPTGADLEPVPPRPEADRPAPILGAAKISAGLAAKSAKAAPKADGYVVRTEFTVGFSGAMTTMKPGKVLQRHLYSAAHWAVIEKHASHLDVLE